MDKIKKLLYTIKEKNFYKNQMVKTFEIPPKQPVFGENINLNPFIKEFLKKKGIEKLFSHQINAIKKLRENKNIVISTPTASGKTLCFNIPVLEKIISDKNATALYVYPAKALANDQLTVLNEIKEMAKIDFFAGIYDGDTPPNTKKILRENANIILTNPYELHRILPYHNKWKKFFKNLKFVILDEAHRYRGVFGSNIAMLIRRLKRLIKFYGSSPQFIISTASLANPLEFSQKLTGENFELILENGAPSGKKYVIFWDPTFLPEKSVFTQTKDLLLTTTELNFQTLCFTTSRKLAELIRMWSNKEKKHIEILSYRAGYSPETRREIEKKLKQGIVKGIVSTNALELGIDIGHLDIIIISGYPGSICSFWQQAGRAGRKMQDAAIFFLPYEDALEKYLLNHPEILLDMNFENAVISIENPNILTGHLLCAISELPLNEENKISDINLENIIETLIKKGLITKTQRGFIYSGSAMPHEIVSLDNFLGKNIKIKVDNKILEEISITRAFREAHPGAIYLNQGETYLITELNVEEGVARAKKEKVEYYTEAIKDENVKIINIIKTKEFKNYKLFFGNVSVTEIYKSYRIKKLGEVISEEILNLPPLKFSSESVWIELNDDINRKIKKMNFDFDGSLHAAEHALIALSPIFAMCEPNDLGGVSYPIYENGKSVIFIYDAYEGGIGISKKLFDIFPVLKEKTKEMIISCKCESGCPYCVYSSKCGNNNNPIDKIGAIEVLKELI
jgi:DEAD/DEAH box helicase domain-containing protein